MSLVKGFRQPVPKWGTLTLWETRPVSGKQWTDSGERHDRKGLKTREDGHTTCGTRASRAGLTLGYPSRRWPGVWATPRR